MDTFLLRIYQEQVVYWSKSVLFGAADLQAGLDQLENSFDQSRVWYGIQNLVIGAGNLSKTLWGIGNAEARKRRYVERQPLRDSLSVTDDSPLREIKVRNDYEHLDERIEEWWNTSQNHNYASELIGPRGMIGGDAIGEKDMFRWFDPSTGDVIFWGNELNIPSVLKEVQRILPIAVVETEKPHWDRPSNHQTSGGGG
jgi:hypothetical protein